MRCSFSSQEELHIEVFILSESIKQLALLPSTTSAGT